MNVTQCRWHCTGCGYAGFVSSTKAMTEQEVEDRVREAHYDRGGSCAMANELSKITITPIQGSTYASPK